MVRAGIDLGAQSVRLILSGEGLVYDEPCIAAFNEKGDILAIGKQAYEMQSSTSEKVRLVRPITADHLDLDALEAMLNELCYEFRLFRLFQKTILLVCYPSRFDEKTISQLRSSLSDLGADQLYFDPEIWMAAIGSGLDLFLPVSSSVLSLGYSNCDLAIFRQGKLIHRASSRILNGENAAKRISDYILTQFNLIVSEEELDHILQTIGCVKLKTENRGVQIHGIDARTKKPKETILTENEVAAVLAPFARELGLWVSSFVETLDPNIRADVMERGIVASGGTMKLAGLGEQIATLAGCPIYLSDEPDRAVARGLSVLLDTITE